MWGPLSLFYTRKHRTTMRTYRLKKGYGRHICSDGHVIDERNPIHSTEANLAHTWPHKFEDVTGMEVASEHPFGANVTAAFPLADEIPDCAVYKRGRRYRIAVDGRSLDVPKMFSEKEVNAALKAHLKALRAGEVLDDDDEPDDEDDEDETVDPEVVDTEDEDDEDIVKPPKKKAAPAKAAKKKK